MDKWTVLALILIFIGNIGGILIVIFQSKNSAKDKDQIIQTTNNNNKYLSNQLELITKEREELKMDLTARDLDNQKKSEEIIQLNRELLTQSKELNKFLGASDAYPILLVSSGSSERGILGFTFTISNEFDYPLYDAEIVVFDCNFILENSKKVDNKFLITRDNFKKSIIFQKDNNLIAAKSEVITSKLFNKTNGVLYVKLKCRNNFVFEKIAFVQIDKIIHQGFIIYEQNGKILKEWYGDNSTELIKSKLDEKL